MKQNINTIKDSITQMFKLMQEGSTNIEKKYHPRILDLMKPEAKSIEKKIQLLSKTMDIKHKGIVFSILELI